MKIHLDTDLGGDADDACALAFLLASPEAEIVGITTNLDRGGHRAGCVNHYLKLANRSDIPLVAGAEATLTDQRCYDSTASDARYWPELPTPLPSSPGAAIDLLTRSIEDGATVVAIGAATNLAMLEVARPGSLEDTPVVFMGGWIQPPEPGLPAWGPDRDWNIQCDIHAAQIIAHVAKITLVPLPATLKAHLRDSHLPRLRSSGPIGELLALQSELYGREHGMGELGRTHSGLPDDLLNFHYDPVTCAVATQWPGVTIEETRLQATLEHEILIFRRSEVGELMQVVTNVDGEWFAEMWLDKVVTLGVSD